MAGDFNWYELWCNDVAKARDFYSKGVGWTIGDPRDGYSEIQGQDQGFVGGMMPIRPEMEAHVRTGLPTDWAES